MGRMKEICIEIMNANGGIPEDMTIADVARMKELETYNWEEYERRKEAIRLQSNQQEYPGEIGKVEQVSKKFSSNYGETKETNNKQ